MKTMPYGTWPSEVTPEMLTEGAVRLHDLWVDGNMTYWLESRPADGGRFQIVRLDPDGAHSDLLPEGFSARSGVHEYGGGAAWVEGGSAWFVNWADQRIHLIDGLDEPGGDTAPLALTPEPAVTRSVRYADLRVSADGAWLVAVRETHSPTDPHDVRNELVAMQAREPCQPTVVFGDSDFVMSPRFADSDRLRWIAWDHPNMPWNETSLYETRFDRSTGSLAAAPVVLGSGDALMQPVSDCVISDRTDWWNVWHIAPDGSAMALAPTEAEVGGPAWNFGFRDYVVTSDGTPAFSIGGDIHVGPAVTPTDASSLSQWVLHDDGATVTAIASYPDRHDAIVRFPLDDPGATTVVVEGRPVGLDAGDVSRAKPISYPTSGGRTAYGLYYPPKSCRFRGPDGTAPPLVVMIHGGPTADAVASFSLAKQFWTSRGFAVVDVNHGGSTGFGRKVRDQLDGQWGIVDVDDCGAAARWLADQGLADPERLVIRGGSAGGFTVLSVLAFRDDFAAGASSYGIADLSALAADTHKFEARYCDRLIGPWPEARAVYEARSPIHHIEGFDRPLIVFQGLDDMVVPPNQSEMIVAALRAKGVECEYHAYEGEGHGFRKAETIVHALIHELAFYQRVLGLDEPTSDVDPR